MPQPCFDGVRWVVVDVDGQPAHHQIHPSPLELGPGLKASPLGIVPCSGEVVQLTSQFRRAEVNMAVPDVCREPRVSTWESKEGPHVEVLDASAPVDPMQSPALGEHRRDVEASEGRLGGQEAFTVVRAKSASRAKCSTVRGA